MNIVTGDDAELKQNCSFYCCYLSGSWPLAKHDMGQTTLKSNWLNAPWGLNFIS
jgi:hypothetical protein